MKGENPDLTAIGSSVTGAYALLAKRLARAGVASPEADAWQLIEAASGARRSDLLMTPRELSLEERRRLGEWLVRRELREPLQRILARANFYGLELEVGPGVLIPRPETERLVELTLDLLQGVSAPSVVDVGTGSGAVALALKNERRDAHVVATDNSPAALAVAQRNAHLLGLEVELVRADLLEGEQLRLLAGRAQAVVSNPPYLPEADRQHAQAEVGWDPDVALYGGEDGLAVFRRLMGQAFRFCEPGTLLLAELDPRNVDAALEEACAWSEAAVHLDLTGRRRFLALRL